MSRADASEDVNVVRCAVDDECGPIHFAHDAAEIGVEVVAEFGFDQRAAGVGAEDEMQKDVARCVRHGLSPLRG